MSKTLLRIFRELNLLSFDGKTIVFSVGRCVEIWAPVEIFG